MMVGDWRDNYDKLVVASPPVSLSLFPRKLKGCTGLELGRL